MKWKIEVYYKPDTPDVAGEGMLEDIANLGIRGVDSVLTAKVYWIEGEFQGQEIKRICSELLVDSVTEDFYSQSIDGCSKLPITEIAAWTVEVRFKPGVTDAVGDSVVKGIRDLGISGISAAQTGKKYWMCGDLERDAIKAISQSLLANEVIQTFTIT